MKVENFNSVPNQFLIRDNGTISFQSYDTQVAMITPNGQVYLNQNMINYSRTTSRHLYIFLQRFAFFTPEECNPKTLIKKMKQGTILAL